MIGSEQETNRREPPVSEPERSGDRPPAGSDVGSVIDARELLRGQREVVIDFNGVRYRLRLTRRNKLILSK
jgi:hypothetical protein